MTQDTQHLHNENDQMETKDSPLVAIVILNWNGRHFLQEFLPSVMETNYANKLIVVADNASTDDSVNFLKENFPAVELIRNSSNEGFAKGYNTALKQIQADYYVLLNSDVEVTKNWIEPMLELLEADSTIGACQPKILSWHKKTDFEYAGASGGWIDKYGYPFARGRVFDHCEKDMLQYQDAVPCFWASGAALFVRSSVYHQLYGLDEYFFAHQEEIDLCWRMQLAGYRVYVQPNAVVYHVGAGTLAKSSPRKTYLNYRNNLIMLYKNYPRPAAYGKILLRLMLDGVASIRAVFSGEVAQLPAILKAHLHFYRWLFIDKKKSIFPVSRKGKLDGVYKGSIILDYFFRGKKTFLEIIGRK